nr:ATP-binding cassette domain-containing protein [Microbacterium rhizomatis]
MPSTLLELVDVTKVFPGVRALDNVSIEVRPGEVHALIGENGAGKSTLMAVAAGELRPEQGRILVAGDEVTEMSPLVARDLGIVVVHQEPALVPALSVAENILLATPAQSRPSWTAVAEWSAGILEPWVGSAISPHDLVEDLPPDRRCLVEIARAFASQPQVLVLDEPTEHLDAIGTTRLFAGIRALVASGSSVVYISHRIGDVREISDRISVMRDGVCEGTFITTDLTTDEIVRLVVGRELSSSGEDKSLGVRSSDADDERPFRLEVSKLENAALTNVSFKVRAGEIVGLAGIDGHGQREILAALAGLQGAKGSVTIDGRSLRLGGTASAARAGVRLIPGDRRNEGIVRGLSVRENLTLSGPPAFWRTFVDRGAEARIVSRAWRDLRIKATSPETPIETLSGGNQQKVVFGRTLEQSPRVLLADEPTQGVDIGARQDVYALLHGAARDGAAVLVASTDLEELAQLADRILVLSRGHVVAELSGTDVDPEKIAAAVLSAASERTVRATGRTSVWSRISRHEYAASFGLIIAIAALTIFTQSSNDRFLSERSIASILTLFAALCLVALGQQVVMLVGGFDLSVGPLMGFLLVVGTFVLNSETDGIGVLFGVGVVALAALAVGATNAFLTLRVGLQPVIATLVTFIGLQGISLLLRPTVEGDINPIVTDIVKWKIGFAPVAAIVAVILAVALQVSLKRTILGVSARAVGSDDHSALRLGVRPRRVRLLAYLLSALLTMLAAYMLMAQVGTGDPTAGINYTLTSITAVVLGGASIFGGRASFVGAALGALLIQTVNSSIAFLRLGDAWQYYLIGATTLLAAGLFSRARTTA